jgi:hypothetical protein
MDEEEFSPEEDLNPQEPQGTPVDPPPADLGEYLQAQLEELEGTPATPSQEVEEATDAPAPAPTAAEPVALDQPDEPAVDPFMPPQEGDQLEDVVPTSAALPEMDPGELPPQMRQAVNEATPRQPARGYDFPGLPPAVQALGDIPQTLPDDGLFTQQMEQESAGRDAQGFMFRAEQRHATLMTEAAIEYAKKLSDLSTLYERSRF